MFNIDRNKNSGGMGRRFANATLSTLLAVCFLGVAYPASGFPVYGLWYGVGTNNTNTSASRWTYREGTSFPYALMGQNAPTSVRDNAVPALLPGWRDLSPPNHLPRIFKHLNQAGSWDFLSNSTSIPLAPQTVFLRPSATQEAVMEFLMPAGYTYAKGVFTLTTIDNTCGNGVTWRAEVNGVQFGMGSGTLPPGTTTGPQYIALPNLPANSVIDFVVDSVGNDACDTTSLNGFIEAEP